MNSFAEDDFEVPKVNASFTSPLQSQELISVGRNGKSTASDRASQKKFHDLLEKAPSSVSKHEKNLAQNSSGNSQRSSNKAPENARSRSQINFPESNNFTNLKDYDQGIEERIISLNVPLLNRAIISQGEDLPGQGTIFDNTTLSDRFHLIFRQLGLVPSLETPMVLGVTSSLRGEGRTFTSLGLAIAISQQIPQPVLLIEADMGAPSIGKDLGLENQGLAEYLREEIDFEELICDTSLPDLSIILAGNSKGESLKILRSERLDDLFDWINHQYAAVIVDLAPLSMTAESNRLMSQVDQVLMVVAAGSTPSRMARAALQIIPPEKRTGVILNRTRLPFGPFHWIRILFNKVF